MKNNKKICIVTRALINGGAERVIAQLANYFVKNGIECSIITIDVIIILTIFCVKTNKEREITPLIKVILFYL